MTFRQGLPPIVGAIRWARFLFARIKIPMVKLRSMDQLLQSEQGTLAKQRFIEIGTVLKEYERELFAQWLSTAMKRLPLYIKQTLLINVDQRADLLQTGKSPSYRLPLYVPRKDAADPPVKVSAGRSMVDKLKRPKEQCHLAQYVLDPTGTGKKIEIKYLINYEPHLRESLIECYYLEKLGFDLPETLVQTALQYSKFEQLSNELQAMLESYHLTVASLDTIEVSLLQAHVDDLQRTIQLGAARRSFGDIGNLDYVARCKKELEQLHSVLNQIRKISADIREHLETFRSCIIDPVQPRSANAEALLACRAYFEYLDGKRREIIANLKRRYELIGPLLIKIEALVFSTNTGKHPSSKCLSIPMIE